MSRQGSSGVVVFDPRSVDCHWRSGIDGISKRYLERQSAGYEIAEDGWTARMILRPGAFNSCQLTGFTTMEGETNLRSDSRVRLI